jgi:hypothetical protein
MSKKLTWEQVEARCTMYEEAANALFLYEPHEADPVEKEQKEFVRRQLLDMSKKFYTEQCKKHGK